MQVEALAQLGGNHEPTPVAHHHGYVPLTTAKYLQVDGDGSSRPEGAGPETHPVRTRANVSGPRVTVPSARVAPLGA